MKIKLLKHQQDFVDLNPRKSILAWGTRVGKSFAITHWMRNWPAIKFMLVCPKRIKQQWKEHLAETQVTNVTVFTKEEVKKADLHLFTGLVVDECFVKGTKVLTPGGYKKIETLKVGDEVMNAIGVGKVTGTSKRTTDEIYKVTLSNGEVLKVTGNHPFFVHDKGWVKARELTIIDELLHYKESHVIMGIYERNYNQSLHSLWRPPSQRLQERQDFMFYELLKEVWYHKIYCKNGKITSSEEMSNVWEGNTSEPKNLLQKTKKQLLQHVLQYKILPKNAPSAYEEISETVRYTDEEKQSHAHERSERKNDNNSPQHRSQAKSAGRERSTDARTAESFAIRSWRWLVCRTRSSYKNQRTRLSNLLQDRHSSPQGENSNRGGRDFSPIPEETRTRQKENPLFRTIRVESIEIQKRESNEVFNISVSGHPSYIVGDVVVHNCHWIASSLNKPSQLTRTIYNFVRENPDAPIVLATATPLASSPENLRTLVTLIGHTVNKKKFQDKYYNLVRRPFAPHPFYEAKKNWRSLIEPLKNKICHIVKLEDITDVPPQIHTVVPVKLASKTLKEIKDYADESPSKEWYGKHQLAQGIEKLSTIKELSEGEAKVIVVCKYKSQVAYYAKELAKDREVVVLTGDTKDQSEAIKRAHVASEIYFICQADAMEGFRGDSFSLMIYASMSWKYVSYQQSLGRMLHLDKQDGNEYVYLLADDKDKSVYERVVISTKDFNI